MDFRKKPISIIDFDKNPDFNINTLYRLIDEFEIETKYNFENYFIRHLEKIRIWGEDLYDKISKKKPYMKVYFRQFFSLLYTDEIDEALNFLIKNPLIIDSLSKRELSEPENVYTYFREIDSCISVSSGIVGLFAVHNNLVTDANINTPLPENSVIIVSVSSNDSVYHEFSLIFFNSKIHFFDYFIEAERKNGPYLHKIITNKEVHLFFSSLGNENWKYCNSFLNYNGKGHWKFESMKIYNEIYTNPMKRILALGSSRLDQFIQTLDAYQVNNVQNFEYLTGHKFLENYPNYFQKNKTIKEIEKEATEKIRPILDKVKYRI